MENKKRYEFAGFAYGTDGDVQLVVRTLKENGHGYTMEVAFEMTPIERAELITHLVTLAVKDNA